MANKSVVCTCGVNEWSDHKRNCIANELCICETRDITEGFWCDIEHTSDCFSRCRSFKEIADKHKNLMKNRDMKKSNVKMYKQGMEDGMKLIKTALVEDGIDEERIQTIIDAMHEKSSESSEECE